MASYVRIPMEKSQLPSPALGWGGGGEVAIDVQDEHGIKTAEPFYEILARLGPAGGALLLHGRSGKICFKLPPEPLAQQAYRRLRQTLQKRYKI